MTDRRYPPSWLSVPIRQATRVACRLPVPGRYALVEALYPLMRSRSRQPARIGRRLRIACDLDDLVQRQIYFGLYEPEIAREIARRLAPGDVFIDVGANVGYFSLLAAERVGGGGQVHAFEPVPANCAMLREFAAMNRLGNIVARQVAVFDGTRASVPFHIPVGVGSSGWGAIATGGADGAGIAQVASTSLDEYVQTQDLARVRLVKIDAEGVEAAILAGARALLARADAPDVIAEVNPFLLRKHGADERDLVATLEAHGFTVRELSTGGLAPVRYDYRLGEVRNILATKRPG